MAARPPSRKTSSPDFSGSPAESDANVNTNPRQEAKKVRRIRLLLVATLIPLFGWAFTSAASAHDGTSSVIFLDIYPDGTVEGQVEHPYALLNEEFGFELDPETSTEDDVANTNIIMKDFNTESLVIEMDGELWPITFTDTEVVPTENTTYAGYNFVVDRVFDEAPRVFDVTYSGIFDTRAGHSGFVTIRTDPVTGTFLNEADFQPDLMSSNDPTTSVNLDDPNTMAALRGTIWLGMEHIFIGTDHILFVLVLLLPAVMLFSLAGGWQPVPDFKSGLWRVLKIATMFTIAHSITLTLGGLEIIELPGKFVETVIALSIIAAAFHNLKPIFANQEHLIAFAFGIFHGFGFAGLLSDLGVGRGQRLLSLFGFNLGVEIGQAFIILLLFPALYLLRRTVYYPMIIKVGSMLLALVAAIWAIERIFETSLGIDDILEKFTRAPRVFALVAIVTAIAAAVRQVEDTRGQLIQVDNTPERDQEFAETR